MALSNADNPAAESDPVPPKKAKAAAKVEPEPQPAPVLVKASTSGSADVQNLLAQREIAVSNQDEAHVAAVDAALAALGYTI